MKLDQGTLCPLLKKDCVKLQCAWFTKVAGYDTNTGKEVEEWQCAIAWMPMLMVENSGQQRQTGAAVESFRNEMVKAQETSQVLFLNAMSKENQGSKQIDVTPPTRIRNEQADYYC